jgi:hypothetical protein
MLKCLTSDKTSHVEAQTLAIGLNHETNLVNGKLTSFFIILS